MPVTFSLNLTYAGFEPITARSRSHLKLLQTIFTDLFVQRCLLFHIFLEDLLQDLNLYVTLWTFYTYYNGQAYS